MKRIPILCAAAAGSLLLFTAGCGEAPPPNGPPIGLVIAHGNLGRPTVAAGPHGQAVCFAWTAAEDSLENVYLARLEADTTLSAAVRVNDRPGDAASHAQPPAQVAAGPDGAVYVAWISQTLVPGRRFPASDIRLARSTDGGQTFEPAVTVNQDAGFPTGHHFHNLAVGPDGTVYVSWLDSSMRDQAARAIASESGEQHAPVQPASHQDHGHGNQDGLPGTELRVARSTDGGRTFVESVIAEGTCQCCRTALAFTEDGAVYVAWRHIFGSNVRDVALARSADGGRTFSAPVRVHADGWALDGCPHAGPALAVDGEDRIHVVWYTGAVGRAGVYHAVSADGGEHFEPPTKLAADVPIAQVGAAAVPGGGVWLAWEDPQQNTVRLARAGNGRIESAQAFAAAGKLPMLAATQDGYVLAWRDGDTLRARIAADSGL